MKIKNFFAIFLILLLAASLCLNVFAQKPIDVYYRVDTTEKVVALTFDDGPHPRYTDEILAILKNEGIRATFFAIGSNIMVYPDVMRRVIDAGHEIGNHTYHHPIVKKTSAAEIEEEIRMTDAILQELGCVASGLFRPPQGMFSPELPAVLKKNQKTAILWNIDTRDWEHRSSKDILTDIEKNLCGGDIILFHDYISGENTTIPAIKKLIPMLKNRGYQFVTVSELLALKDQ